jgi:hypothetical protein
MLKQSACNNAAGEPNLPQNIHPFALLASSPCKCRSKFEKEKQG